MNTGKKLRDFYVYDSKYFVNGAFEDMKFLTFAF